MLRARTGSLLSTTYEYSSAARISRSMWLRWNSKFCARGGFRTGCLALLPLGGQARETHLQPQVRGVHLEPGILSPRAGLFRVELSRAGEAVQGSKDGCRLGEDCLCLQGARVGRVGVVEARADDLVGEGADEGDQLLGGEVLVQQRAHCSCSPVRSACRVKCQGLGLPHSSRRSESAALSHSHSCHRKRLVEDAVCCKEVSPPPSPYSSSSRVRHRAQSSHPLRVVDCLPRRASTTRRQDRLHPRYAFRSSLI